MGCESNQFCKELEPALRKELCAQCHRQLLGAGSLENHINWQKHAVILLDGLIFGKGYGDSALAHWPHICLSRSLIITPGYLVGFSGTIQATLNEMEAASYLHCETACCIAQFDQDFLQSLAQELPALSATAAQSTFKWAVAMSEFTSLALAPSINEKVAAFMAFLEHYRIYCSETQIAKLLGCSRTSVSRSFIAIEQANNALYAAYFANKNRRIELIGPEQP